MNVESAIDYEALIRQIERYLAVVDVYRAAGYEPSWLPEATCRGTAPDCPPQAEHARLAH